MQLRHDVLFTTKFTATFDDLRWLVLKVYTKFHVGLSDFLPIIIKSYILTLFPTHNGMNLLLKEYSIMATGLK